MRDGFLARRLMRHTDLQLTMRVYTEPRIFDLAGAMERLPIPAAAGNPTLTATGTEGEATATVDVMCKKS